MTESEPTAPAWARWLIFVAAGLAVLLVGATVGLLIGRSETASDEAGDPKPNKVDIGFSQDMSVHHQQAVELGDLARQRGQSAEVRQLGYDMATTQFGQIGRMQGWLTLWDAPQQAVGELMTWMDGNGHDGMTTGPGTPRADEGVPMPGMATRDEISTLGKLSGKRFDVYFLRLILRHHQGGTAMSKYAAENANIPAVQALARSIVDSQGAEMLTIRDMLEQRGAKPLPG